MMLPPRNSCFAATLTEKLNISRGFAQNTQKVFWTETQLCWMRDNDHKDSFCLKTPLWMNVSNAAILKGVKKKNPNKSTLWLYLILTSKLYCNQNQPKRCESWEVRHHWMLLVFQMWWISLTFFPSLVYLFVRSKNLESNEWILWHPKAKAKPTTGNVHSRAVVGTRDPSRTCGSASALIPR